MWRTNILQARFIGFTMFSLLAASQTASASQQVAPLAYGAITRHAITESNAMTFPGPADFVYQAMPGHSSSAVIFGPATLVTLRFTAESQCSGGGTDSGWCGVRILVDGVEANPAPADFAFDSTNNGADGSGSWEGHAMERHICVRNPDQVTRLVPVQVEWRVFSGDGDTTPPTFRIDDTSLTIESMSVSRCP